MRKPDKPRPRFSGGTSSGRRIKNKPERSTYQGKEVFTSDDFDYAAAKPGDYVEEAVVDAAMNCLPPICMSSACAQMGDPYGMRQDPTTGAWRSTYATFKRCLDVSGIWEYCGHCFSGETVERGTPPPNM